MTGGMGDMVTTRKPRTPAFWPRMRIRGRRRRALAAQRLVVRTVFFLPAVVVDRSTEERDGLFRMSARAASGDLPTGRQFEMRFESVRVIDGYGRRIR